MSNPYPSNLYSREQKEWCLLFEAETTFEPMMADFEDGKEIFEVAAEKNIQWFVGWAASVNQKINAGFSGLLPIGKSLRGGVGMPVAFSNMALEFTLREDRVPRRAVMVCPGQIGGALAKATLASLLNVEMVEPALAPVKSKPYYRQFEKRNRF
jgi:hypothetical protein